MTPRHGFKPGDRVRIRRDQLHAWCASPRHRPRWETRAGTVASLGRTVRPTTRNVPVRWDGDKHPSRVGWGWLEPAPATTG